MSTYIIPPFQPRPSKPPRRSISRNWKTLRSLQIFPYRRRNLPNSNAPCARFRLWRKDLTAREKQVELLKALEKETYRQAETLQKTVELQRIVFGLRAQVHQISVSFAQAENNVIEEYRPESSLLLVSKATATSSSNPPPIDVHVHPRYIPSKTTYLEIVSCPSSPLSFPSPSISSAPSPASPLFQPYTPNIVPCSPSADDTATLHLANITETLNLFFNDDYCYRALNSSFKNRKRGHRRRRHKH